MRARSWEMMLRNNVVLLIPDSCASAQRDYVAFDQGRPRVESKAAPHWRMSGTAVVSPGVSRIYVFRHSRYRIRRFRRDTTRSRISCARAESEWKLACFCRG
jgi:hypothetical protein